MEKPSESQNMSKVPAKEILQAVLSRTPTGVKLLPTAISTFLPSVCYVAMSNDRDLLVYYHHEMASAVVGSCVAPAQWVCERGQGSQQYTSCAETAMLHERQALSNHQRHPDIHLPLRMLLSLITHPHVSEAPPLYFATV